MRLRPLSSVLLKTTSSFYCQTLPHSALNLSTCTKKVTANTPVQTNVLAKLLLSTTCDYLVSTIGCPLTACCYKKFGTVQYPSLLFTQGQVQQCFRTSSKKGLSINSHLEGVVFRIALFGQVYKVVDFFTPIPN